MKSRFMIVLISLILAAGATVGAAYYIAQLRASLVQGQELVEVVVAKKSIDAGLTVVELFASGALVSEKIPRQYVADGAITSIKGHTERVLGSDLGKGEQLTRAKLKRVDESGLAYRVPEGKIAVAIAVDEVTGVGGALRPGDRIDVIATLSPGPGDIDTTRVMLQNVEILVTSDSGAGEQGDGFVKGQQSGVGKKTVTVAVTPAHAEKLVFAAEKGHVWLGLRHVANDAYEQTAGQTVQSVFE
ncbi:MAG: Flp pilus assembly protein CpaB [Candidatus Aquicultor sp.]|nr:Flp pilus assembly protein CpaB [Candidatus Aquicultor sp.]